MTGIAYLEQNYEGLEQLFRTFQPGNALAPSTSVICVSTETYVSLSDIPLGTKLKVLGGFTARILVSIVLMTAIYAFVPDFTDELGPALTIFTMLVIFGLMILLALRSIRRSKMPQVRSAEVLIIAIIFYLFVFAALYLSMSKSNPESFSTSLGHIGAFYFTVTVFATVGFGDITPTDDTTMLVVSFQMLLNLFFIYVGIRLIIDTGRQRAREVRTAKKGSDSPSS